MTSVSLEFCNTSETFPSSSLDEMIATLLDFNGILALYQAACLAFRLLNKLKNSTFPGLRVKV